MSEQQQPTQKRRRTNVDNELRLLILDVSDLIPLDLRDLILQALELHLISLKEIQNYFSDLNSNRGLDVLRQPQLSREGDDTNYCFSNFKGAGNISKQFGNIASSGALLRFTIHPQGLHFRHPNELVSFVKDILLPHHQRRKFVAKFLETRFRQVDYFVGVGTTFLEDKKVALKEREDKGEN